MSKVIKTTTETEIIFHLSGARLITQYIDTFLVNTPFETIFINYFINCSITKNQQKIEACKVILDDHPQASVLFKAIEALANQTYIEFRYPITPDSKDSNPEEPSLEFHWLDTHQSMVRSSH